MKKLLGLITFVGLINSSAYAQTAKIGAIERGPDGIPLRFNFNEAIDYCKSKGTRVPTFEEYLTANDSGSLSSDPELRKYKYWTSSEAPASVIDKTIPVITVGIAETLPTLEHGYSSIHPVITFEFGTQEGLSVEWSHYNVNDWTVVRCVNQ